MAIQFESPQPVSPQISAAYGSTEELAKNLPALASIYQRNAAMQQAAEQHAQSLQAQMVGQQAQIGERRLEMQQHGMDQAAAFATARLPSERDVFQANAQMAEQNNRAVNAAWLSQQQLSQHDVMEKQRMEDAVGYVNNAPNLTDDQRNNLITQLRTKLSPLQQRFQQQQIEHRQKQDQLIDGQLRKQAEHEETNRQFQAKMMQDGKSVVMWADDNGRRHPLIRNDKTGEWYNPLQSSQEVTARVAAAAEEKRVAAETKVVADAEKSYEGAIDKAKKEIERRAKAKTPDGKLVDPTLSGDGGSDIDYQQRTLEGLTRQYAGGANSQDDYVARKLAQHRGITGGTARPGGNVTGGGEGGFPAPKTPDEMEADRQKAVKEQPPFAGKPFEQRTPDQAKASAMFAEAIGLARTVPMPDAERGGVEAALREADGLFAQYGSRPGMPPEAKAKYDYARQTIINLAARAKSHGEFTKEQEKDRSRRAIIGTLRGMLPEGDTTGRRRPGEY